MNVGARFLTVDECNDVGMMKAFEDLYLGVEIFFELLVEFVQVN